jgi:MFS family permease
MVSGSRIALLVDAVTFGVVAVAAVALSARRHPAGSDEDTGEARAGFGAVRRDRMLVIGFAMVAIIVLFAAMDNVAEVFFARESLHSGAWGYGVLASVWIVGMVIGSSQIARRLSPSRLMPALAVAAVVGGAAVAVAGLAAVMAVAVVLFVVGGVANGVITVSMRSIIVHRVDDRYRGRVFAAYGGLFFGTQLAAMALAGGLVAGLNGRIVLIIGGVGTVAAGVAGLLAYRSLPAAIRAMPGAEEPTDEVEESADVVTEPVGEGSLTTELLSSDHLVPEAMVAQAIEGTLTDSPEAGEPVPDRPDVTRIPESEPVIQRAAER